MVSSNQHPPGSCLLGGDCDHVEQRPSNELDYPPKFSEYEAEWSKRGYEPHIATLLAKADWSEDMINWQEDEIDRLHNEIEAGGSRERGTSPNRSCGTAGQSGPASSLRSTNEPGPTLNDAIRCIDYADCMLAQSGYTEDSTIRMRLANARAIISGASQSPNDGWSALCEAVAKADPVNYRRPTQPPPDEPITINGRQVKQLWDFMDLNVGPSDSDDTDVSIRWFEERPPVDGLPCPAGYYAWFTDYPEEGSIYLDDQAPAAQVDVSGNAIAGTDVATAESVLAELDRLSETKSEGAS